MTADLSASAYLLDGADLAVSGVTLEHDGAGLWDAMTENVFTTSTPGDDGADIDGGSFQPYTLTTGYVVRGTSAKDVFNRVRSLRRACKPGRTVTLTRRMPDPEGTDANTDVTTPARRTGDRPSWLGLRGFLLDIDWLITEPWHGPSATISATGTQTVLGDIRTRRMTITLPAGAARTVANTTAGNGHSFTFGATVPAGGVLIDVEACKATAITGGADLSGSLSWTKKYPMQLEAGSNTFTVSAGSASISYQPAYL